MKAPIEWLKEYIKLDMAPEKLADRLTMTGVEVGAIEYHGKNMSDVVVGKVKNIERHATKPDISICQVDTGSKILQIVTKASNLKAGDRVPVALHGATLPSGIKVQKRELHGVESFGMLCSEVELGLADTAEGIMILDKDAAVGEDIRKVLGVGGAVIDLDVLPNRIDLLSIIGIAREIGAVLGRKIKVPPIKVKEAAASAKSSVKVTVKDFSICPRYAARVIKGVKVKDSPQWIQDRILACGMRPVNNIVDITNYVLLECGQPLHAFDLGSLNGPEVIVRRARKGEKIKTLDGESRALNDELVIADSLRPVAVAGIMGGQETEVKISTSDILLESAYFDPKTIHKGEKSLKLRTEASTRFDRGVDWDMVMYALDRAASLIAETSGGQILKGVIDIKKAGRKPKLISFRPSKVDQVLGSAIKPAEIKSLLNRLGFVLESGKVSIPLYRAGDVEREIDVIEEIARIYGYDKLPSSLPKLRSERKADDVHGKIKRIKEMLIDLGITETSNYSMVPRDHVRIGKDKGGDIALLNPITEELAVMRSSLMPSLLKVMLYNQNRQAEDVNIFELDKIFYKNGASEIAEELQLGIMLFGSREYRYDGKSAAADVFQCKMIASNILNYLGAEHEYVLSSAAGLHPGRSADILRGGKSVGYLGELHPDLARRCGANGQVYVISIDLKDLLNIRKMPPTFKGIPQFPSVKRDIAMIVPENVPHNTIVTEIRSAGGELVESIKLFDKFEGKNIENGYYSLAYSITYRSESRTLTDIEVGRLHQEITDRLTSKLGVKVRK